MKTILYRFVSILGKSLFGGIFLAGTLWPLLFVMPALPSDFQIYVDATRKVFQGGNPYQPFLIGASYIYPPTAFLLFAPFAFLSDTLAIILFRVLNVLGYVAALLILIRIIRPSLPKYQLSGIVFVFLIFAPFIETLFIGQVNGLILLGIVGFVWGLVEPRLRWIGDFGLAFAIAIKISPALLLAYPLLHGDWKRLARVGSCLLGLFLLALLGFGIQPWVQFVEVFPALFSSPSSHALTSLMDWRVYNSPIMGLKIPGLKTIITVCFLAVWVAVILRFRRRSMVLEIFSLGVITMTIASSLVWFHHFVFLVFPIFFLLMPTEWKPWRKNMAILTLVVLFLIQIDRMVTQIIQMPLSAMLGYLLLYGLALSSIFQLSAKPAAHQYQKLD